MGRYDGEYYAARPPCPEGKHERAFNGTCHVCKILCTSDGLSLAERERRDLRAENERLREALHAAYKTAANLASDHDDYLPRIEAAVAGGNRFRREDVLAMLREVQRCRLLLDDGMSFREIEAKIRDGALTVHAVGSDEQGAPALRFLAAILLHILLGEDATLPPNYQGVEWSIKPAGEVERMRVCAEIVKPGGQSSHEIRRDLEAKIVDLEARLSASSTGGES